MMYTCSTTNCHQRTADSGYKMSNKTRKGITSHAVKLLQEALMSDWRLHLRVCKRANSKPWGNRCVLGGGGGGGQLTLTLQFPTL